MLFFKIYLNALNFRGQLPFTDDADDDVLADRIRDEITAQFQIQARFQFQF